MSDAAIGRLFPAPAQDALSDDELSALYDLPTRSPWVRVNFVSSVDGAATVQGLSAGLGGDADHRVFDLLRRLCDVVVVGAGTVRAEGYGPMRVDRASQRARVAAGLTDQPVFALVSAGLDLDPASRIFTDAPVRPIVITAETAPAEKRDALAAVADVLVCGVDRVDPAAMVAALAERGLGRIHCEGGPHLFGDVIAAGAVDELCLTVSPTLVAGTASRIATGATPEVPPELRLAHVLQSESTLLLRYVRP
ncbi:pyrimidine reductase family protein [Leifsonia aquatica]|uniref:Riboflavin biosynthesis protein RibD protein n=2 Tax=Leifsonia aquatica TaxID=144185 RepID=U2T474_LEIAQ|nr:pyrimidine reductase family protein [Leifsonia aquatica]ERK69502.1 riboflavin biosynthesis protein RibD protein [Leifsonia aquatica ATCC 14665]MBB2969372.1 riboflavin biosynthesis pyrimidine reductase [Leifsonia aquatica]